MKAIECIGLNKVYGENVAVDSLSLVVEHNKMTGIIGPNGAGKTTLLKLIAGFLKATAGEMRVFGEAPFNNLRVSANAIFIDDRMVFPSSLCLDDICRMAARVYANWDHKLARGLLDYFALNPKLCHAHLSRGQKSTVNAILGLAAHCPLTIFDEPTLGMDVGVRRDFYRALLKDYMQHPRSILFSSHMLLEVEDILEDIVLLKDGYKVLHLPLPQLTEYAVGLAGNSDALCALTENREVLHTRQISSCFSYVVIKNDLKRGDLQQAQLSGVDITAVPAADLCVYLTEQRKGGIDDVFSQTKSVANR
ncbi:MAG: ABC transporter ATP-binding protein YtrB [Firmicutes bacterium]|nr:ABC transporter ATP-binding protein YtrB [candidate division NPL-UPA2 bacterium]